MMCDFCIYLLGATTFSTDQLDQAIQNIDVVVLAAYDERECAVQSINLIRYWTDDETQTLK